MTWTPTLISRALDLRARGFSSAQIGRLIGKSRNSVVGKLWRNAGGDRNRKRPRRSAKKNIAYCETWDVKTFESYSDRKARLANEARNKTTNANA